MTEKKSYADGINAAKMIVQEHVRDATAAFVGGSFLRDEQKRSSDLDIVAISNLRARSIRHNLVIEDWRVDLTIHTTETLLDRLEDESCDGVPRLASLLLESIGLLGTDQENELKRHTMEVLDHGPPPLASSDSRERRFRITELVNDLRDPHSRLDVLASAGELYHEFANFVLRANGHWGARGKWIPREIERHDPTLARTLEQAFSKLATDGQPNDAIDMVEDALQEHGGFLYDGYVRTERRRTPIFDAV